MVCTSGLSSQWKGAPIVVGPLAARVLHCRSASLDRPLFNNGTERLYWRSRPRPAPSASYTGIDSGK
jgi:hypothetical protein